MIGLLLLSSSICFGQTKGGRWMFENNGNDVAVWDNIDNNGSLSGTALFSNVEPKIQDDYYLSLEDSADYGVFTVPDQEELDFNDENFAASLWVYPVEGYDNPQHLFLKGERSGSDKTNNYALRLNNEFLEFIVHSESGAKKVARSTFKVAKNEWNFLAVFYDYNNSKLYMWNDNQSIPIDTLDFDAPLFPNSNNLYVGTSGENGFKRFWGRIDDLRIGNKVSEIIDEVTSVEHSESKNLTLNFSLSQNYPNPFNPATTIRFTVPTPPISSPLAKGRTKEGFVKLIVYNTLGQQVATLVDEQKAPGSYEIKFDASNLSSGVYFYKLQAEDFASVKKLMLIK